MRSRLAKYFGLMRSKFARPSRSANTSNGRLPCSSCMSLAVVVAPSAVETLRVRRPVAELLPGVAQEYAILVGEGGAAFVRRPVRKRGDERDGVEPLTLAPGHRLFEADALGRHVVVGGAHSLPRQPPGRRGQPGVAGEKKRRAIRVTQRMAVFAGAHETTTVRILPELGLTPRHRAKAAGSREAGIVGAVAAHAPAPLAGMGGNQPHLESAPTVPEAVDTAAEIRTFELDPAFHVDIWIGVITRRGQRDFLQFPDVHFARLQPGMRIAHQQEKEK